MLKANADFTRMNFPCGEPHVNLKSVWGGYHMLHVTFEFEKASEILDLMLLVDAARRGGSIIQTLTMPYVPFSRQDRVANDGDCFSLAVFCDLINSLGFKHVEVTDPHSDVSIALLKNVKVIHQHEVFKEVLPKDKFFWLISPDAGALKKIYKLSSDNCEVVECSKLRDTKTGAITGTKVHTQDLNGKDCYIVDDICDGGGTFIAIAKELKKLNSGKIFLCVTHGFFTKGIKVFDGLIDHIYTLKGQVK